MGPKVKFVGVSKSYQMYKRRSDRVFDLFCFKREKPRHFFALKDVSFEVYSGECIGVIGINGAGKSTLSNVLANIISPTTGDMNINGQTSLVAISAGLNNSLTGRENIELKCLMYGLDKATVKEITPKIIQFADIGSFLEQPLKNYSSGMKSRLGFAISIFIEPDILVIDEALSVGDQTFNSKCIEKMNEFKASGKTIFFISHSLSQVRSFTDRVLWLHYGEVREFGKTAEVLTNYQTFIEWYNKLGDLEKLEHKNHAHERQFIEHQRVFQKRMNFSTFIPVLILMVSAIFTGLFMFLLS
ncbi:ATP-binding cassette domain-containing protein [Anaerobacillus alkaliphilus]|uniref:ATP-binding cassette domain-containing protein n=1 Tax=Anaerobacillus alkaliphilus TaxID=1548597 RepID=A0A4Q0VT04_9BACI|nr:ATP-binding cassette domain-containing protein [Anaerobacillus alkaliphilus]RXJ01676.1 ATP-binding cassette domain-containing protein [Anaerobacillus alkaliphilus]